MKSYSSQSQIMQVSIKWKRQKSLRRKLTKLILTNLLTQLVGTKLSLLPVFFLAMVDRKLRNATSKFDFKLRENYILIL